METLNELPKPVTGLNGVFVNRNNKSLADIPDIQVEIRAPKGWVKLTLKHVHPDFLDLLSGGEWWVESEYYSSIQDTYYFIRKGEDRCITPSTYRIKGLDDSWIFTEEEIALDEVRDIVADLKDTVHQAQRNAPEFEDDIFKDVTDMENIENSKFWQLKEVYEELTEAAENYQHALSNLENELSDKFWKFEGTANY